MLQTSSIVHQSTICIGFRSLLSMVTVSKLGVCRFLPMSTYDLQRSLEYWNLFSHASVLVKALLVARSMTICTCNCFVDAGLEDSYGFLPID
ncbi:hypothetical protein ARMSODRAFT_349552 [Armillaria solidipes]|uniref:Uncharacterized protein n=1 Tax=Armillaria solidipes TaxID=1076256 RepID=A0A2H3BHJ6_9AGAR|nr:hypothetical protein ARMSODRAFT_349552 [Armillaria solidipes]